MLCPLAVIELSSPGDVPCPCIILTEGTDAPPVPHVTIPDRIESLGFAVESFGNLNDAFVGIDYFFAVGHDTPPYRCHGAGGFSVEFCWFSA